MNQSRYRIPILIAIVALVVAIAAPAANAAVDPPTFSFAFGKNGSGNGEFKGPHDLAFDPSGNLWVTDQNNDRVQKFNSKGEYLAQFGKEGTGNGQLRDPRGIAIDSEGNIWVVDTENNRVQKFNSKGEYLTQIGKLGAGNGEFDMPLDIAIDPSGNLWVADTGNGRVQKFNSKGEYQSQFGAGGSGNGQFEYIHNIAADPEGNIWVTDYDAARIQKFSPKGEYLSQIAALVWLGIAIDAERNLWVGRTSNTVSQFFAEGEAVSQFGQKGSGEGQFIGLGGIAVDSAGNLWVADAGNHRVQKWVQPTPPPVTTGAATQVKRTEATLNATINPQGVATSYQFEYGPTTSYGTKVPLSPKSVGSGSTGVKVSEALNGLKSNTTYHYRVAAITEKGTSYGADRRFTTLVPAGPEAKWRIGGKTLAELGLKEVGFTTAGTYKIEVPKLASPFNCQETGQGTISSTGAVADHITLTCELVGVKGCVLDPIKMDVDGKFNSLNKMLTYINGEGCLMWDTESPIVNGSGSFDFGTEGKIMNVTASHTTSFGLNAVYISGSSYWELTSPNVGKTLGLW